MELKDDGRIFVNGKFIESLLINGKDFFQGNPQLALENLPSYMVDKVKVYEKTSRLSELTGRDLNDKSFVMDVNLKKEYSIGWIANTEVGYGTKDRYMARLFALRFGKLSGLYLFANANNLNDQREPGRNGEWRDSGWGNGLTSTKKAGIAYYYEPSWVKRTATSMFTTTTTIEHCDADNETKTATETFLDGGNAFSRAANSMKSCDTKLKSFNYYSKFSKLKNKTSFGHNVRYSLDYNKFRNKNFSRFANFSENPSAYSMGNVLDSLFRPNANALLRSIATNRLYENSLRDGYNFQHLLDIEEYYFPKSDDIYKLHAYVKSEKAEAEQFSHYLLDYPANETTLKDYRNRYIKTPTQAYEFLINPSYKWEYSQNKDSISNTLFISYEYQQSYRSGEHSLYRLDQLDDWGENTTHPLGTLPSVADWKQSAIDFANSYYSGKHTAQHTPSILYSHSYTTKKRGELMCFIEIPIEFLRNRLNYQRNHIGYPIVRKSIFIDPRLRFFWTTTKKGELEFDVKRSSSQPQTTYLLDIRDNNDPLNIYLGNIDLKDIHNYHAEISFRQNWSKHTQFFNAKLSYDIAHNAVAMGFVFDKNTGVRTYRPHNVNGNYSINGSLGFGRTIGEQQRFSFSTQSNANLYNNVDMISVAGLETSKRSVVRNLFLSEEIKLDYKLNKDIKLGTKLGYHLTHATSARTDFETINASAFNYGLTAQAELLWALQLSTDLTAYSRRGYSDASLNTNELVWNARLSKTIMKGKLTFILEGFDILGNLSNVRHSVNAQGRTETYYNVIPRYMMLRAIYKLNIQPKKKGA